MADGHWNVVKVYNETDNRIAEDTMDVPNNDYGEFLEGLEEEAQQGSNSALSALLDAAVSKVGSLRRSHLYCEDSWYSCPKHEDGCANEAYDADECNCGADEENQTINEIVKMLNKAKGI